MEFHHPLSLSSPPAVIAREGALDSLPARVEQIRANGDSPGLILIDPYFEDSDYVSKALRNLNGFETLVLVPGEPTTDSIDQLVADLNSRHFLPSVIVSIGGGAALDSGKALSVSLTNPGSSADYQGWDLLTRKGIPKIGIPTMLGTGAESSQTAVLRNPSTGLKLGQNSAFVSFDSILIDFNLTKSVPLYRGMINATDAYFHAFEILSGRFRNAFSDALAELALTEVRKVFSSKDFFSHSSQSSLSLASFFGGLALTGGFVGIIHPLSAVLGEHIGLPHTVANVLALKGLKRFYPTADEEVSNYLGPVELSLPCTTKAKLREFDIELLRSRTLVHRKPLENALGPNPERILSLAEFERIREEILKFLDTN